MICCSKTPLENIPKFCQIYRSISLHIATLLFSPGCVVVQLTFCRSVNLMVSSQGNFNQRSLQCPLWITPADTRTQHLVLAAFFIYLQKLPLGLQQLSDCNTLRCIYGTNTNSYMALSNKSVYYNSPKITDHPILCTHYSSRQKKAHL